MRSHCIGAGIHARLTKRRKNTAWNCSPVCRVPGMQMLRFDGGLELRAGRNKGDAVLQVLTELESIRPLRT